MSDLDLDELPLRKDTAFELSGQSTCKLKMRTGGNPLVEKNLHGLIP